MNENQLLDAMIAAPLPPLTANVVEPIVARGYGSQQLPTPQPRVQTQPLPQPAMPVSSTNSSSQEQVFMDSSYGYVSTWKHEECAKVIPDYRLATSCANCAFSTYDPIQREANCQKWKTCVIPFYVCDSHINPSTLAGSQENFSEVSSVEPTSATQKETISSTEVNAPIASTKYADIELYAEALTLTPSFDIDGLAQIFSEKKYQQLFKAKYGDTVSPYLT